MELPSREDFEVFRAEPWLKADGGKEISVGGLRVGIEREGVRIADQEGEVRDEWAGEEAIDGACWEGWDELVQDTKRENSDFVVGRSGEKRIEE